MGKRVLSALIFLLIGSVFIASAVFFVQVLQKNQKVFVPSSADSTIENTQKEIEGEQIKGIESESGIKVTRVVDGDTVVISTGETVRYIGIDTPETVKPGTPVQCFGKEASAKNKELVLGKVVTLAKDVSEVDKYGRLLRYIYVDGVFINDYLIRNGFASASTYPPDVKYSNQFKEAEKEARENKRGLWAPEACNTIISTQSAPDPSKSDCPIKGNINSKGEKIYHTPGQQYYNKTQIDESAGEKMFCTEKEAEVAGWRKSKV
ncbi:MAG: thermonuclease family protein [bacterium]|nr:thermonuclease family protein [bacterium]